MTPKLGKGIVMVIFWALSILVWLITAYDFLGFPSPLNTELFIENYENAYKSIITKEEVTAIAEDLEDLESVEIITNEMANLNALVDMTFNRLEERTNAFLGLLSVTTTLFAGLFSIGSFVISSRNASNSVSPSIGEKSILVVWLILTMVCFTFSFMMALGSTKVGSSANENFLGWPTGVRLTYPPKEIYGKSSRSLLDDKKKGWLLERKQKFLAQQIRIYEINSYVNKIKANWLSRSTDSAFYGCITLFIFVIAFWLTFAKGTSTS